MSGPFYYSANSGSFATCPKSVSSYEELKAFNTEHEDAIIVLIDFEAADHEWRDRDISKRYLWSELGVAFFDPRVARYGNNTFDQLAQRIDATHLIDDYWQRFDEETCPCLRNHNRRKHVARLYHCQFAKSEVIYKPAAESWLVEFITSLARHNLTDEEIANGEYRKIKILYWDQRLEMQMLEKANFNLNKLPDCPNVESWDFQTRLPFEKRVYPKPRYDPDDGWPLAAPRVGCLRAITSLGILSGDEQAIRKGREHGIIFHNAANDTVAQILCWLRFVKMTVEEWKTWFEQRVALPRVDLIWVDPVVYQQNYEERPTNRPLPEPTPPPSPEPVLLTWDTGEWVPFGQEGKVFADQELEDSFDSSQSGPSPEDVWKDTSSPSDKIRDVLAGWRWGIRWRYFECRDRIDEWKGKLKSFRRRPKGKDEYPEWTW